MYTGDLGYDGEPEGAASPDELVVSFGRYLPGAGREPLEQAVDGGQFGLDVAALKLALEPGTLFRRYCRQTAYGVTILETWAEVSFGNRPLKATWAKLSEQDDAGFWWVAEGSPQMVAESRKWLDTMDMLAHMAQTYAINVLQSEGKDA